MLNDGIKFDDLHYTTSAIDSYGKPFNFVISEREAGKTTALVASKIYKAFKERGRPALILRNQAVDISEAYVMSFEETTNKFFGREIKLSYRRGDISKGICLLWDESTGEKKLYAAIAALSAPIARLKSINIGKLSLIMYDEAIVAASMGERYPDNLAFKVKEIYKTFSREIRPEVLKMYCMGNPYSKYHPLLVDWGVPFQDMKRGSIITGPNWAVECYEMKPELREFIIAHDPTYQFDDAYRRYAFDGASIEDEQISISIKRPEGFAIRYVFKVSNRYLYVWRADPEPGSRFDYIYRYWIQATAEPPGKRQSIVCADFTQLCANGTLLNLYKGFFGNLKTAVALNRVLYADPEAFYLTQIVYGAA